MSTWVDLRDRRNMRPKVNYEGTLAPTVDDDSSLGYEIGSEWLEPTNARAYVCVDATVGAALWEETTHSTWLALRDTLETGYAGNAGKLVQVANSEDGLSFIDPISAQNHDALGNLSGMGPEYFHLTAAEYAVGRGNNIALGAWVHGSDTIGTPDAGEFDTNENGGALSVITSIRVLANNPDAGISVAGIVDQMPQEGYLYLQDVSAPGTNSAQFTVTAHTLTGGVYWDLTVSWIRDFGTNWGTSGYSLQYFPKASGNTTDVTLAGEDFLSLSGQEITANAIDLDNLSASGSPTGSNFLRGDNTWATPSGGGDVVATGTPLVTEYARWTDATTIEGRTKAQTLTDLDLEIGVDVQAYAVALDNVTNTNSGDQTIELTGDVTGSGTGTFVATIADNAVGLTEMTGWTAGNLITYDAAGDPAHVATGTSTQVLTSNGAGAAPTFEDSGTGGVTNTVAGATGITNTGDNTDAVLAPTYGSSVNTICQGNDARLSDARTPTSHAYDSHTGTVPIAHIAGTPTGTGDIVLETSPVLVTPTVASFTNATHDHADAAGGGTIAYGDITGTPTVPTLSKSVTIPDPVTNEDVTLFYTPVAITITQIAAVIRGTTPSVLWFIKHATMTTGRDSAGTAVITAGTTTTDEGGVSITSFDDATIPADSFLWVETTTVSGTNDELALTVVYTED